MLNAHTTSSSDYKDLWDNIIIHYYHHHNLTPESNCEPVWIKSSILYSCVWQFSPFFFRFRSSWLGGGNVSNVEQICSRWNKKFYMEKPCCVMYESGIRVVVTAINERLITSFAWLTIYAIVAIWQISSCSIDLLTFLDVQSWGSMLTTPFSSIISTVVVIAPCGQNGNCNNC